MEQLNITPKTKVLALIEAYPKLEDLLVEKVPAFQKLKNPLLRKTVAKVATLQQAAAVGNLKVEELVNFLRSAIGQNGLNILDNHTHLVSVQPPWYNTDWIVQEIDISEMLEAGEHPANWILSELNKLQHPQIFKLTAPFLPVPLIEKSQSLNFQHWISHNSDTSCVVYFTPTV